MKTIKKMGIHISDIQRKLNLGYNAALKFQDNLKILGIINSENMLQSNSDGAIGYAELDECGIRPFVSPEYNNNGLFMGYVAHIEFDSNISEYIGNIFETREEAWDEAIKVSVQSKVEIDENKPLALFSV